MPGKEPTEAQIVAAAKAYVEHREGACRWSDLSPGAKQYAKSVCRSILCAALAEEMTCCFCAQPAGKDALMDENGEMACRACGEAEFAAQAGERGGAINQSFVKPEKAP